MLLFYVSECLPACVSVHRTMLGAWKARRGRGIPWNWTYIDGCELWALGIEPKFSQEQPLLLITEPSIEPPLSLPVLIRSSKGLVSIGTHEIALYTQD